MQKEKRQGRLRRKFTMIFIINALISIIISTTFMYVNMNAIYKGNYTDNLRRIGNCLEMEIGKDIQNFSFLQSYFKEDPGRLLIPYDIDTDSGYYESKLKSMLALGHPGMDIGNIDESVLSQGEKQAYAEYLYVKYLGIFERTAKTFDFGYIYYIYHTQGNEMCYMLDFTREEKLADGKRYINLGITAEEDPAVYPNMWASLETGRSTGKPDTFDNEYANSYAYYVPVKDGDEVLGLICTEVNIDLVTGSVRHSVIILGLTSFIILMICALLAQEVLMRLVTRRIELLAEKVCQYSEEKEPSITRNIRKGAGVNDEIGILAGSVADMIEELDRYMKNVERITAEREKISAELAIATSIQASALPDPEDPFPDRNEFELYACMDPAKEVGGDFYDFYMIDDDHLALTIADVSDKGVPAALFMMSSKLLLKNRADLGKSPKEVFEIVNNQLCENNENSMFVSAWLGILDINTGRIVAANAGHEYPLIRRAGESFEMLRDKHGLVLAGMENVRYKEYEIELKKGDSLFVYTDGVAEATSLENELFGMNRMLESINRDPDADVRQRILNMRADIDSFTEGAPQFDDITMLSIDFYGKN